MRRALTWLLTLPLSLVSVEIAHALINSVVGSPTGRRGEFLERGGPGAGLVPWLIALALMLVLAGLAARTAGYWPGGDCTRVSPLPCAMVGPLAFVVQEHLEDLVHSGSLSFATVLEPTFLPGLALQAPFALAAYLIARFLLGVADVVRVRLRRPRVRLGVARATVVRVASLWREPRGTRLSARFSGRAPPAGIHAAG